MKRKKSELIFITKCVMTLRHRIDVKITTTRRRSGMSMSMSGVGTRVKLNESNAHPCISRMISIYM